MTGPRGARWTCGTADLSPREEPSPAEPLRAAEDPAKMNFAASRFNVCLYTSLPLNRRQINSLSKEFPGLS